MVVTDRVHPCGQTGFTTVELLVALIILSIGLIGLASTTGFVVQQNTLSDVATERTVARQSVIESIRARPFASVGAGERTVGDFEVEWRVIDEGDEHKTVRVVTTGRGLGRSGAGSPALASAVSDTVTFHLLEVR